MAFKESTGKEKFSNQSNRFLFMREQKMWNLTIRSHKFLLKIQKISVKKRHFLLNRIWDGKKIFSGHRTSKKKSFFLSSKNSEVFSDNSDKKEHEPDQLGKQFTERKENMFSEQQNKEPDDIEDSFGKVQENGRFSALKEFSGTEEKDIIWNDKSPYQYFQQDKKTDQNFIYTDGKEKMAVRKEETRAGGGAVLKGSFDKNGELHTKITLKKDIHFLGGTVDFLDKNRELFDDVLSDENAASASNFDDAA